MRKLLPKLCLLVLTVAGNTYASTSWDTLSKIEATETYCTDTFSDPKAVELCQIEWLAWQRAKNLCALDTAPDYCVLMAKSGWKNHKQMILKGNITQEGVNSFPVMCGWKKKPIVSCDSLASQTKAKT
jgi:hypothetical protein